MADGNGIGASIRRFVEDAFFASGFSDHEPLIDAGVLDSTGVLQLVAFLEQEFGIDVLEDELVPENLGSVERAAAFVQRKRGRTAA